MQAVVTKNRMTFKSVGFKIHSNDPTGILPPAQQQQFRSIPYKVLERFSFECRKVIGFAFATLHNWLKKFAPILYPIGSKTKKPKPIVTHSHAFSRALRQLPVFTSSFDWFTVLCVFFVIG